MRTAFPILPTQAPTSISRRYSQVQNTSARRGTRRCCRASCKAHSQRGASALVRLRRGRPIRLWSLAFRRQRGRTAGKLPVAASTQARSFSPMSISLRPLPPLLVACRRCNRIGRLASVELLSRGRLDNLSRWRYSICQWYSEEVADEGQISLR